MNIQKYETILSNNINGNISICNKSIKKLTKLELIDFMEYIRAYYSESYPHFDVIKLLRRALNS